MICDTGCDLVDIPKRLRGAALVDAVEAVLRRSRRFSIFSVDFRIGEALEILKAQGRIRISPAAYPYSDVVVP
jgi:hypothetical protein